MSGPDVIDDLEAEQDELDRVLAELTPAEWTSPSAAAEWTVADVVLHLAQTEEAVSAAIRESTGGPDGVRWKGYGDTVEEAMGAMVRAEPASPADTYARWQAARRNAVQALRAADPGQPVRWVTGPLKPRTLATTRLAEHWAHALDITGPLGIDHPDTPRLRHIAWLGHATLPYAFRLAGLPLVPVFCDLTGPDGASWQLGDPAAESTVSGAAGTFCRVGAQRLDPAASGLRTTGPHGTDALRVLRNFAA